MAQQLVTRAVAGDCVISTQVLAEFAATLLHKLVPAPSSEDVVVILDALAPTPLITADVDMVRRAGSAKIWPEDLNAVKPTLV